jgi:peptidylprolyl isomerase
MKIRFLLASLILATLISSCQNNSESELPPADEYTLPETGQATEDIANTSDNTALGGDTITTKSGLQYIILKEGNGPLPKPGRSVSVNYTGYLLDGTKFDSSVPSGRPFTFRLGTGSVIRGWDEGIALLKTGTKARLILPYHLAYGEEGYPPLIPPSTTLIFDIDVITAE